MIIPRNSSIPCAKRHTYTTTENYQDCIDVRVFEGERPCTDANHLLGEFVISGIEVAKKGEPQIEVSFALDANGVLQVTAQDKKTRAKASCTITNACRSLEPAEIARMVEESEKMRTADCDYKKKLDLKMEIEDFAYGLDDAAKDALLEWLDNVDLGSVSVSALEEKLRSCQRA